MANIPEVVERIKNIEKRRKKAGEKLSAVSGSEIDHMMLVENELARSVDQADMDGQEIVGVDGGLLKREYQGIDIVMTRAVGAKFSFDEERVEAASYLPSKRPVPDVQDVDNPLNRNDLRISSSILRVQKELEVVKEAVREEPDLVLIDGSIVPQYTDRPAKGTYSREYYDRMIETYQTVFSEAINRDVLIAGVIEDSRSSSLGEIIADAGLVVGETADIVRRTPDTAMLFHVLEYGQRTCVMRYTEEYEDHPTLADIGRHGDDVYNMYLQTAKRDVPVRIDFLADTGIVRNADAIASRVLSLCEYSNEYGIPSVILEADQRAKLSEEDLERFEAHFDELNLTMPGMRQLRRNNRPF